MRHNRGYYDVLVQTCAQFPSNIAVRQYINGDYQMYTYSELYGACEYISQNLQQLNCKTGVIGLISDRNVLIPSVIAAAHKYSTSFMFLDPSHGIEKVFTKIKFRILITIQNNDGSTKSMYINKKPDRTITVFNLRLNFYNYAPSDSLPHQKHVNEHSFIAMTSGSTGDPKHIQVPMQCLQPNIDDLTKLFKITTADIIYFSTPLTFDPSMIEILIACHNGASLLIAPERVNVLFPLNKQNSVTFWQTTPSKFLQLSNYEIKNIILSENSTLKILALGGEPLNGVIRLRKLKDPGNQTRIFTLYGVTEMSCWACVAELDLSNIKSDREVPLGKCLSETQLIIEPSAKKESNQGKIILVSKTRKCIVMDKTSSAGDQSSSLKFIDTGDLAEVRDGTIYYIGRTDDIVKRFGHKVNLQKIESIVMQCSRVKTCSCVWIPKPMLLVVYFSSEHLTSNELSHYLKCKLDDKHWPDKIIRVDNLPTNLHGKISKQIMTKMYENINSKSQPMENCKFALISELNNTLNTQFSYEEIKNKDFFAIGGTSFLAVSMCNKISQTNPDFGRLMLPLLLSQESIRKVVESAQKEMCTDEVKVNRRVKRARSSASPTDSTLYKKANASPSSSAEFIVCWSHDTGKCVDASPTFLLAGLNLYVAVGSHSGKIIVVDTVTGHLQGEISLTSRIEAPVLWYQHQEAPTCGVVGTYDGTIVCFTLQECKILWEINIGSMIKSKAACCNGILYIASYDGNVRCIDVETGAIKEVIHIADQAISADLVLAKNEYILLGTLSGVCASVYVGLFGGGTRRVAWRCSFGSPVFASPVLYNNDKYVVFAEVNGEIHCRTVEKGIEIWKFQGAKGNVFSSIYIKEIDNLKWQMVFGCHDSKVYSIIIKKFQPSLLWTTQLTSPVYATPTALSDKLILAVSNDGKLHTIDSKRGVIITEYQLPEETFSSPAVYGEYIFIGCRNDHLYCLRFVSNP